MPLLLNLIFGAIAAMRTLPGAVTAGTAVTAGLAQTGGAMPQTTADWIVLACGAIGAAVSFVQINVAQKRSEE